MTNTLTVTPRRDADTFPKGGVMARIILGDKSEYILKGILNRHGMNGAKVARKTRQQAGTVTYQIRHAENMSIDNFRKFVDAADMTDAEIVEFIRG